MDNAASNRATALKVTSLEVRYGEIVAVRDVSFEVAGGECIAIVGPNGNGKSSIVMGIAGLVYRRGDVRLFGEHAPRNDSAWVCRHGFTLIPERRQLYNNLTVEENVLVGCYAWTKSLRKAKQSDHYARALELFPELLPHYRQKAGTLSGGQAQMVAIARGLAAGPRILAVDEPCLGLAESVADRVYEALSRVREFGTTLVLLEETPTRALAIADREVRIENGMVSAPAAAVQAAGTDGQR